MKADLSKLFVLDEAFKEGAARAKLGNVSGEDLASWMAGRCADTVSLRQDSGDTFCDLVGTTCPGFYLLSLRVQDALKKEVITGWTSCPVDFRTAEGKAIEHYAAIGITGRCGKLD